MSAVEKLKAVQSTLVASGVRAVNFSLHITNETSHEELAADLADVLERIECGQLREIDTFAALSVATR